MHPSIDLIKWDYGALDEEQEQDYITEKMKLVKNTSMYDLTTSQTNHDLSFLILQSQSKIRSYAETKLRIAGIKNPHICAKSTVSQRDIQRFFKCYQWFLKKYEADTECDITFRKEKAVLVSLGIVYCLRLPDELKDQYSAFMDNECKKLGVTLFSKAFKEELDWCTEGFCLPEGIAGTYALKQNVLATVVACVNRIPLIIVGEPGTSKSLSFNITIDNLKGKESPKKFFSENDKLFPSLHPFFYQCSQCSTSEDIQRVFSLAIKRQDANQNSNINSDSVVFMDEAGLPEERHESLKVLHYYLDNPEVSFVAITNDPLDSAKTNRAICVFRPAASIDDLKILARSSTKKDLDQQDNEWLDHFCASFSLLMSDKESKFNLFYGLRDFANFISYIHRQQGRNKALTTQLALRGLERNMNGHDQFDEICEKMLDLKVFS